MYTLESWKHLRQLKNKFNVNFLYFHHISLCGHTPGNEAVEEDDILSTITVALPTTHETTTENTAMTILG